MRYEQMFYRDTLLYEQRIDREWLRRSLRDDLRAFLENNYLSFELKLINAEGSLRISDRIYNYGDDVSELAWGCIESGNILYVRAERDALRQIVMSELTHEQVLDFTDHELDVMLHLSEHMPEILWHKRIGGEATAIFTESGTRKISRFLMAGDSIYFSVLQGYRSEFGALYYTQAGGDGSVLYLDEDVTDYVGLAGPRGERLVYRTAPLGSPYTRNIMLDEGGSSIQVAGETDPFAYVKLLGENNDIIAFFRAQESGGLSLYIFSNDRERFIAQAINDLHLYSDSLIYLMCGGHNMGLYIYSAGEITQLSESVADAVFF